MKYSLPTAQLSCPAPNCYIENALPTAQLSGATTNCQIEHCYSTAQFPAVPQTVIWNIISLLLS